MIRPTNANVVSAELEPACELNARQASAARDYLRGTSACDASLDAMAAIVSPVLKNIYELAIKLEKILTADEYEKLSAHLIKIDTLAKGIFDSVGSASAGVLTKEVAWMDATEKADNFLEATLRIAVAKTIIIERASK